MAELPQQGEYGWGPKLSEFLLVAHNPDGTLKDGGIGTSEPADNTIVTGGAKFWWDATAGAPTLRVKGKDSAGAIFTATVPMTEV